MIHFFSTVGLTIFTSKEVSLWIRNWKWV